jgi:hypothetical protein
MSALGPKADLAGPKSDFRSTPESGLNSDIAHVRIVPQNQKWPTLFDHFVGAREPRGRHGGAERRDMLGSPIPAEAD